MSRFFKIAIIAFWSTVSVFAQESHLSIQVDNEGVVRNVHWPTLGLYSQMADKGPDAPGLRWGIVDGETIRWIGGEGWVVNSVERDPSTGFTTSQLSRTNAGLEVTLSTQLGQNGNSATSSVHVKGIDAPELVWYADFDPTTHVVPELDYASDAANRSRDFGAGILSDSKTILHFRPDVIGREATGNIAQWIERDRDFDDWGDLGSGTWIAMTSPQHVTKLAVGEAPVAPASLLSSDAKVFLGDAHSLMVCTGQEFGEGFVGSVQIAFGATRAAALDQLAVPLKPLQPKSSPAVRRFRHNRRDVTERAGGLVKHIESLRDPRHGAFHNPLPAHEAGTPVDVVRASYTLYALGLAGRRDLGDPFVAFLKDQVYDSTDGLRPLGSVSRTRYASGISSEPFYQVELLPAAALIWGIAEYGGEVNARDRHGFFEAQWFEIELMADFIVQWSRPLLSHVARIESLSSDAAAPYYDEIASIHFGLLSATRVCQVLGKEVPQDWSDAQGRANRAISSRDRVVFAPWDIEFGRLSGRYVDVRDYEAPTTLESAIEAQSDEEKLFTLVSAAYQASKIYPSGRIGSRLLAPVADSYFDQYLQSFDAPYEGADTSLLLIILYKSYQSIR